MIVSIFHYTFPGLRMQIFIKIPGFISPQIMLVFFNFSILGCLLATLCLLGLETTYTLHVYPDTLSQTKVGNITEFDEIEQKLHKK